MKYTDVKQKEGCAWCPKCDSILIWGILHEDMTHQSCHCYGCGSEYIATLTFGEREIPHHARGEINNVERSRL